MEVLPGWAVLAQAAAQVTQWHNLLAMLAGTVLGIIIGALPGFNASLGVALTIPLTYPLPPETGLILLAGLYAGAIYGGSITTILVHTPGEPGNIITAIDGYAMTRKGQAGRALGMSALASWAGGIIGGVALLLISPALARASLAFGPSELFFLAVFGLTVIIGLSRDSLRHGLISGVLGLLLATVGTDLISGAYRYTGNVPELYEGIPVVIAVLGLYSAAQVFQLATQRQATIAPPGDGRSQLPSWQDIKNTWRTMLRSGLIGTAVGIVPGPGMSIGSAISYDTAKRLSRHPESFGQGEIEGVAASEAGNNAVVGGSLIPMLTLGIPGNAVSAIFMGGLLIHGLRPGPRLFAANADVVYALMLGFLLANTAMAMIGLAASRWFAQVARLPVSVLAPVILSLSVIGAYATRNNLVDVFIMLGFGVVGFLFERAGIPLIPMVLGLILGPMAESELRRALMLSGGSFWALLQRPISLGLAVLSLLALFGEPLVRAVRQKAWGGGKGRQGVGREPEAASK